MRFVRALLATSLFVQPAFADCYAALSWDHPNESSSLVVTTGYTEVPCTPVEGQRTAVIIVMGQSLAANTIIGGYTPRHTTNHQLNIYDGKCYLAKSRALGTSGVNAAWVGVELADVLIDRGAYDRVVMVPMAIGGTWASEWANVTNKPWLGRRIGNVACMLQSAGLVPTHVVWMQGESDNYSHTTQTAYTAALNAIVGGIRGAGITAPILVNVESWLNGMTYAPVRNAQMAAVGTNGVVAGANMDSLNNSYRYDGTHLNAAGSTAAAGLLADIIAAP